MPNKRLSTTHLTKPAVDAATTRDKRYEIWDSELSGFGLRVETTGRKLFIVRYRADGGGRNAPKRLMTLGVYGVITPKDARDQATKILGAVSNGADPAGDLRRKRQDLTVADLCDLYLKEACVAKKPATKAIEYGRIERHIKPLLGAKRLSSVRQSDVLWMMRQIAEGKTKADLKTRARGRAIVKGGQGTASRTVVQLSSMFSYAVREGVMEANPAKGIRRWKDGKRERYLSEPELKRLGEALAAAEADKANPKATAIIRLLALTGARKGEIIQLKWCEVDFDLGFLRLLDSKTGAKAIPVGKSALSILAQQKRLDGSPYVFHADKLGRKGIDRKYFQGTEYFWYEIRRAAKLEDVRLHDLRHTAASIAVADGASLPVIGRILGHSDTKTTQRYAHLSDAPVREAVEKLAAHVDNALAGAELAKSEPAAPSGVAKLMGAPRSRQEPGWRPARRIRR
ncbi:MAG: integrase [Alphaproteobacteria bacterium]|nr:MAG: integrase [Alphaproteobacteria bacterium]